MKGLGAQAYSSFATGASSWVRGSSVLIVVSSHPRFDETKYMNVG